MAIGKPRSNRRSPGGSCSYAVTMVVVVTLCVLGVWKMHSNSSVSFSKTSSWIINTSDDNSSFIKLNRKIPTDIASNSTTNVYDNNGDDLPMDVIQHDDENKDQNVVKTEPTEETASNVIVDDDAESLNDSDVGKQEAEQQIEEAKEDQEIEISTSVTEDSTNGLDDKTSVKSERIYKTRNNHLANDESSIISDDAQIESETMNQENKQTEEGNEDEISELEDNREQEINNVEEDKTVDDQQDQEQHEDDGPIESHSIAAETKARVEKREAIDIKEKMEQAKIESTVANITTTIKDSNSLENSTFVSDDINDDNSNYEWKLCNANKASMCLVPIPEGYKKPIPWPQSKDKIWLHNMGNKALSYLKGHQNLVKVTGEFITFPKGALHYINFLQEVVPAISWGKHTRVVLDVGCGVASFGGNLFDKDVLTMSLDEQETQIQIALERGIPAISAVMGTQRLPFPSRVFDLVHCVHCKVPWHKDGGIHLLEVNRILRPGGYFVWSATPVYRTLEEDVQIWKEMSTLTVAMCWELLTIKRYKMEGIGVGIYRKPVSNECYNVTKKQHPPMCVPDDDPNAAWCVSLQTCIHKVPTEDTKRGSHWPEEWPERIHKPPYWLNQSQIGIYGKPALNDFEEDYEHWKTDISRSYMNNLGIDWSSTRNVMDMRAVYGGFAAALKEMKLWVLNVVNIDSPDTLPIIFERGLFGIYHDWCESFSTYPRTYDLLHADHLFSNLKNRCKIKGVMAEIDRILRPEGYLIARDEPGTMNEIYKLLESLHWEVNSTFANKKEGILIGRKSMWRPTEIETVIGMIMDKAAFLSVVLMTCREKRPTNVRNRAFMGVCLVFVGESWRKERGGRRRGLW
ncbi:probable methyltransferase PMT24 [Rutidosis leptorrhynchoides]|uniref:probable methyltransferase PMT24 n=1 Tax=Rutidosis leptorrhynchoides TaxID=125765 RepID=UPI003A98FD41